MIKRSNLILSILSLITTLGLLVCALFAWYVTNQEAEASGIKGATEGKDATLELERWDMKTQKWVESTATGLHFSNIDAGYTMFFRIKVSGSSGQTATVSFAGVTSSLVDDRFVVSDDEKTVSSYGVYYYDIETKGGKAGVYADVTELYELDSSGAVLEKTDPKTAVDSCIYEYNSTTKKLELSGNYDISKAFLFYSLGGANNVAFDDKVTVFNVNKYDSGLSVKATDFIKTANFTISTDVDYQYFAIEFNDKLSIATIDSLGASSNLYLYQKLSIDYISVNF